MGLLLWYENILPALLPFTICSNLLLSSGYIDSMVQSGNSIWHKIFGRHSYAVYPIVAGFLFGFPLGSKITADLWREHRLSDGEANVLCAMCNNISPAFVSSYLLLSSLKLTGMTLITYMILYLPPFLLGMALLHQQKANPPQKKSASKSNLNFQMIDAGIMNGFETMVKLGGYIMLFSLLVRMIARFANANQWCCLLLTGLMEVTNGIHAVSLTALPIKYQYMLAIAITSFGGLSGMAQTASMSKGTACRMSFYLLFKAGQTVFCTLAAYLAACIWLS